MQTNDREKVLRALNPLSCQETQAQFYALLRGEIQGEEEEWLQEHLLVCEECWDAFNNKLARR